MKLATWSRRTSTRASSKGGKPLVKFAAIGWAPQLLCLTSRYSDLIWYDLKKASIAEQRMSQLERLNLREKRNCDAWQIRLPVRAVLWNWGTLPFAFRSTELGWSDCRWSREDHDDRRSGSVSSPGWIPARHSWQPRCLQHRWLSNSARVSRSECRWIRVEPAREV